MASPQATHTLALDLIGHTITHAANCRQPFEALNLLKRTTGILLPSAHSAFLLRQADSSFELATPLPENAQQPFESLCHDLIETGVFSHALRHDWPHITRLGTRACLTQAIATRRRIYGLAIWIDERIALDIRLPIRTLVDLIAYTLERLPDTTDWLPHGTFSSQYPNAHNTPTDQLTGLAYRSHFLRFLQRNIELRKHPENISVMLLDVDNFHRVNREFGSEIGDNVLRTIAQRLDSALCARTLLDLLHLNESDFCFARTGADEFALALKRVRHPERLADIARCLHTHLADGFYERGFRLHLSVSIGVASTSDKASGHSVQALLRRADAALKRAKHNGRNQFAIYDSTWDEVEANHLRIESWLQEALERDQFELFYQPLFTLTDARLVGAEVLLRSQTSNGGPRISPAHFIPIAESSGQIADISRWVIRRACYQMREWDAQQITPIPLSINVSAIEVGQPGLASRLLDILVSEGIAPRRVHVEITETAISRSEEIALLNIRELRAAGFEVWIDDFGTGYASLKSIKNMAISGVKIDREFVNDLNASSATEIIVAAVLTMARQLGHQVIAEGIETLEQQDFLSRHGCDIGQGYYLGKPQSAADFTRAFLTAT